MIKMSHFPKARLLYPSVSFWKLHFLIFYTKKYVHTNPYGKCAKSVPQEQIRTNPYLLHELETERRIFEIESGNSASEANSGHSFWRGQFHECKYHARVSHSVRTWLRGGRMLLLTVWLLLYLLITTKMVVWKICLNLKFKGLWFIK